MKLTILENHGVLLTQDGVIFPDNTPKEVVIDAWKHMKFMGRFSVKGEKSCREHVEKTWGFHEALLAEAAIITELGFEVTARISNGKEDGDPVPVTARFVKMFSELRERWKVAIQSGNVEYLKLAADALKPMVEEWQQINNFLSKEAGK
jgi:hypothetical protein